MTTKHESVLSESERNRICIQATAGKQGLQADRSVSRATEQAVLAKLQPQLDAIGAGGVSGQRETKDPYRELMADQADLINVGRLQQALTKQGISTPESREELNARIGHYVNLLTLYGRFVKAVPEGYKLVPIELTEDMVDASGCEGQFKLSPSDQAQRMWSAMLAAAPTPDTE